MGHILAESNAAWSPGFLKVLIMPQRIRAKVMRQSTNARLKRRALTLQPLEDRRLLSASDFDTTAQFKLSNYHESSPSFPFAASGLIAEGEGNPRLELVTIDGNAEEPHLIYCEEVDFTAIFAIEANADFEGGSYIVEFGGTATNFSDYYVVELPINATWNAANDQLTIPIPAGPAIVEIVIYAQ